MMTDPLSKLETKIAASARERDLKDKLSRDDLAAKERLRDEARAVWATRKSELPTTVKAVDGMLKSHGYCGLAMGVHELKHPDVDRVVIEYEHSARAHSKILLILTRAGEFTCSIGAVSGEVHAVTMPIGELTADRLREVLAQAVAECLTGSWAPRSERPNPVG